MTTNAWAWQDGRNPYRNTAFHILALDPGVRGRAALRKHVKARRQRVANAPERFRVFGRAVSEAEINEAAQRLADPATRILEELRTQRQSSPQAQPSPVRREEWAGLLARLGTMPAVDSCPETLSVACLSQLLPPPRSRVFPALYAGGS